MINNKTKLIISCSSNPSNFGCQIYNYIFKKMYLNYLYVPIKTTDAKNIIATVKKFNLHGASISMPMKNKIYKYIDISDKLVKETKSVNTLINKRSTIVGYNTDYYGFSKSIAKYSLKNVAIYGYGSVVDTIIYSLMKKKINNIYIFGRNNYKISKKKNKYKLRYYLDNNKFDLLINATPSKLNKDLSRLIKMSKTFFDLRVSLQDSDLIDYAKENRISTISGFEMYKYQFLKQFELYTNYKLKTTVFQNSIKKLYY